MKDSKKIFILTEVVLAVMVIVLAAAMLLEKNGRKRNKISVVIQNSNDNQWAALKYGLKMAAEDQKVEMFVVSTEGALTVEEQKGVIEREIENGADAVIVQPASGDGMKEMLKKIRKKLPVILVECKFPGDMSGIPIVGPDNYVMGKTLAKELLNDFNGKIEGKTVGIFSETEKSEAVMNREKGFRDMLKDTGAEIVWDFSDSFAENDEQRLEVLEKVDFIIALDDNSVVKAGEYSAANNLHGALVYGIGHSTEVVYYLDTGFVECLVVPDEFNVGYQSLSEIAENIGYSFDMVKNRKVPCTVIRKETLFSKENQEILFTMSQ